jgi:hypothetical protein
MSDKPRSPLAEVYRANSSVVPITPVTTIPGADQIVPRFSSGLVGTVAVGSSVRDSAKIRENSAEPVTPKTAEARLADYYVEQHCQRQEKEKRDFDAKYIVTFDPITGVRTETPR